MVDEEDVFALKEIVEDSITTGMSGLPLDDYKKQIYDLFFPDGFIDDDMFSAWDSFFEEYEGRLLWGINHIQINTADAAAAKVETELKKKANYVIENLTYTKGFEELPAQTKKDIYNLTDEIIKTIDEADWMQGEQHLTDLIVSRTNQRAQGFLDMMTAARDLYKKTGIFDGEDIADAEKGIYANDIQQIIDLTYAYNKLYGTTYTVAEVMKMAVEPAENLNDKLDESGQQAETLAEKLEKAWAKIKEKNKEDLLESFGDENWATHIKWMQRGLEKAMSEGGDGGDFLKKIMSKWISDEDLLNAMMGDLKWFDDFSIAVDAGDFVKANEILQNGIVATDEELEKLKEDMQELVDEQTLDKLKQSGFASWIEEITQFTQNKDGKGLFEWLLGKDEKSREAFFEMYPLLAETFNTLVQNEGVISSEADEWNYLAESLSDANNQYKNWLENKKKDNFENVTDKEGYDAASSLLSNYGNSSAEAVEAFKEANEALSDSQRDWLYDNIDGYQELIDKINEGTAETKDYEKAMKDVARSTAKWDVEQLEEYGEVLKDMPDWVESCYGGMATYSESIAEAESAMNDLVKAQGYINGINNGTITSTEHLEEAYDHLATVTGYSADDLRNNLAPAQAYLANQSVVTGNMVNYFKNQLQAAGAVDFSTANWRAQLAALATDTSTATGKLAEMLSVLLAANEVLGNPTTIAVPKYSGGGGGGSGGSKDSGKEVSEIEKMLDLMEDIQKIRKHQRELISTTRDYYENEGYLTTVIKYYEDERAAIEENSKVLEENLRKIEALLPAKQKEVAAMDTSDEEYEQAAKDLEALQEAHQEYSLELLENKNTIAEFNRAIKDMQDEIRDMEIELRETILEAIEDREDLNERMLQGTIDVENEIFEVIKARYEKERDLAIETAEAKIEALEAESEALDEQLRKRKEMAEAEDKQLKLAQLQAQLARISADPTRKKEELELRKQIQELRDEMAWDLAEQEVEAQQESIDQQITSLEDYIEQVEDYYEDLFEHPQKLLEEVKTIMAKTDEEILEFLKKNNEDYANSSEAMQQDMVNSWNEMLMDMHGQIKTYWDEVEEIIAGGDEAIIEFLKQHSADYKEAGKLQAEAYVDEWKQQLEDLKRAYDDWHTKVEQENYVPVAPSTGSGSSGGSSGGGGKTPVAENPQPEIEYKWRYLNNLGQWVGPYTDTSSAMAFNKAKKAGIAAWNKVAENFPNTAKPVLQKLVTAAWAAPGDYLRQFKIGGLASFTGPAWLDGSPSAPERILSPYQTKLFEDMIATLHQIKVTAPSLPTGIWDGATNNSQAITFGDIILNVDQLAEDADYTDIVERLMEEINERMTQGMAVGGIRITR